VDSWMLEALKSGMGDPAEVVLVEEEVSSS